jgi:hypothetical protein
MKVRGFVSILPLAVVVLAATSPASAEERSSPRLAQASGGHSCVCRGNDRTFEEGQTTCLRTSEGPRLATCGMVLNNMSWMFSDRPCPDS